MPETDLEIREGRGGGAVSKKIFSAPRASVWSKNKGGARAPPLDLPQQMHHAGLQ